MMFFRKGGPKQPPSSSPPKHRLDRLVREARDRPLSLAPEDVVVTSGEPDVMALLVELRAAGKRGHESAAAQRLGPEFNRYLGAFYNLPPELQAPAVSGLYRSRQAEESGDLAAAIAACEVALDSCPEYLPLLDRLASLETIHGRRQRAEQWYSRLLAELDRLNFYPNAHEICRRLIEAGASDLELLERCGRRLEADNDVVLAARCWSARADQMIAAGEDEDALLELDRAILLMPSNPAYRLDLALLYERIGETDRAALAYDQAESMAGDDPETLARVLLIRARISRPEEEAIGRLMDLLEHRPEDREAAIEHCVRAVAESPYNPHLSYIHGVLLAQHGRFDEGLAALRVACERYYAQADRGAELEVRQAILQLDPQDDDNGRRIAALHFERGEVRLAMQVLNSLAKTARK